ncbi:hypothetical protein ACEWY4_008985 [Coilia grayii]|uniref:Serine-rich and transmembrane domain-containing protein 1 n=1 Tax=Coilia grayii TaxID=363190 RepID=A0ABD1K562_9TELE
MGEETLATTGVRKNSLRNQAHSGGKVKIPDNKGSERGTERGCADAPPLPEGGNYPSWTASLASSLKRSGAETCRPSLWTCRGWISTFFVRGLSINSSTETSPSVKMSGLELSAEELNGTAIDNGTFQKLSPTSVSTAAATSSSHPENVYIYVSIFLSLLVFLLSLLIIALYRLKNIIASSSSYPEYASEGGSSFTNMEICSLSSQRSTISSLSS